MIAYLKTQYYHNLVKSLKTNKFKQYVFIEKTETTKLTDISEGGVWSRAPLKHCDNFWLQELF